MHKYQCASMFNEQHQDMDCQPAASTIPTSTTILKTGYPLLHLEETFILDWVHQNNIISRIKKKKYIYIYIQSERERERETETETELLLWDSKDLYKCKEGPKMQLAIMMIGVKQEDREFRLGPNEARGHKTFFQLYLVIKEEKNHV